MLEDKCIQYIRINIFSWIYLTLFYILSLPISYSVSFDFKNSTI